MGMDTNWFPRLVEVIEADPRSKRQLSKDADLGDNFVQQMIKNKKQPGAENLQAILGVLGYSKMIYVLTGIQMTEADEDAVKAILGLPPALRQRAKELFLEIKAADEA